MTLCFIWIFNHFVFIAFVATSSVQVLKHYLWYEHVCLIMNYLAQTADPINKQSIVLVLSLSGESVNTHISRKCCRHLQAHNTIQELLHTRDYRRTAVCNGFPLPYHQARCLQWGKKMFAVFFSSFPNENYKKSLKGKSKVIQY